MQIFFIFTPIPGRWSNLTSIFLKWVVQPPTINLWIIDGLGWWFGYLGFPSARDCCSGAPLESQTTNHCLISLQKPMGGVQAGGIQKILPMGFLWETPHGSRFVKNQTPGFPCYSLGLFPLQDPWYPWDERYIYLLHEWLILMAK